MRKSSSGTSFNSYKVWLKRSTILYGHKQAFRFNSYKVWLKRRLDIPAADDSILVSIPTRSD